MLPSIILEICHAKSIIVHVNSASEATGPKIRTFKDAEFNAMKDYVAEQMVTLYQDLMTQ